MAVVLNTSTRDAVVIPLGRTEPSLYYPITNPDGSAVDMSGKIATFLMRPLTSRTPVIDAAATPIAPPDNSGNNVRYDWVTGDTVVEGQYMGWFAYGASSGTLSETPEFSIVITDHGPGFGVATGAVVDGISQWMPITTDALRQEPTFGDRMLQRHADYIKRIVMGVIVAPDAEASYDPMLVEYLSKRTALRLITPAKDYWARQFRQVVTHGPSEMATYPDMLANLDKLEQRLECELPSDWRQLQQIIPGLPQLRVEPMPLSSLGDPSLTWNQPVTGDPYLTPPARTGGPRFGGWFMP